MCRWLEDWWHRMRFSMYPFVLASIGSQSCFAFAAFTLLPQLLHYIFSDSAQWHFACNATCSPTDPPPSPPSSPTPPPVYPSPPTVPTKPPTYAPPPKAPTKPPVYPPPPKPPLYPAPPKAPTKPPVYSPPPKTLPKPPVYPPPPKAPTKPPTYAPPKPPTYLPPKPPSYPKPSRSFVAVQGVVFCKSCKYNGSDTLLGAKPILNATVKMTCKNTKYKQVATASTDKNGYFFLQAPKTITSFGAHKCTVSLLSSPLASCSKPTDLHSESRELL
ncbi:serine/threonine-protein kinase HT1-like [Hibiscus syriacus]|uniref:Serine/threonine-protein kinase HT1-like n=1 Tax=Hibiscus syriacus TaxID=106335 RepID=A0A6A2ZEC8_HIBSY|nr:serine/threonine-protein kinase HT1-like [Hibiscus syriacus]